MSSSARRRKAHALARKERARIEGLERSLKALRPGGGGGLVGSATPPQEKPNFWRAQDGEDLSRYENRLRYAGVEDPKEA